MASRSGQRLTFGLYCGGMASLTAVMADHFLDLRRWKTVHINTEDPPVALALQARTRPPPIGLCDWPGGRVLLHWALHEARLADVPAEGQAPPVVLEIGSGIGSCAIGMAIAGKRRASPASVIATDVCPETLANLRANRASHGLCEHELPVSQWDAAAGAAALETLPCSLASLTHVIGADVVYHGFDAAADGGGGGGGQSDGGPLTMCLEATLGALLRAKPGLQVTLLLEDRFSGGTVSALAGAAGVSHPSTTVDPAIAAFERGCAAAGLRLTLAPVPSHVVESVCRSQSWLSRFSWWVAGTWDGLVLCTVSVADGGAGRKEGRKEGRKAGAAGACSASGSSGLGQES